MKVNILRCDLTDISAIKEGLVAVQAFREMIKAEAEGRPYTAPRTSDLRAQMQHSASSTSLHSNVRPLFSNSHFFCYYYFDPSLLKEKQVFIASTNRIYALRCRCSTLQALHPSTQPYTLFFVFKLICFLVIL